MKNSVAKACKNIAIIIGIFSATYIAVMAYNEVSWLITFPVLFGAALTIVFFRALGEIVEKLDIIANRSNKELATTDSSATQTYNESKEQMQYQTTEPIIPYKKNKAIINPSSIVPKETPPSSGDIISDNNGVKASVSGISSTIKTNGENVITKIDVNIIK